MKIAYKILIFLLIVTVLVGLGFLVNYSNEVREQWCLDNPVECAKRAEESRLYLERESKKELNCGPSTDFGWGGWRCEYEDD